MPGTVPHYLSEVTGSAWDKGKWFMQCLCQRDENMYEIIRLAETISENLPGSQGLPLLWIPSVQHSSTFFPSFIPSLSLSLTIFISQIRSAPSPSRLWWANVILNGWLIQKKNQDSLIWKFSPFFSLLRSDWFVRWHLNEKDKWRGECWMVQVLIKPSRTNEWVCRSLLCVCGLRILQVDMAGRVQTCHTLAFTNRVI